MPELLSEFHDTSLRPPYPSFVMASCLVIWKASKIDTLCKAVNDTHVLIELCYWCKQSFDAMHVANSHTLHDDKYVCRANKGSTTHES